MTTIGLSGMVFQGYHGVYPQERELGARYEVNISLETNLNIHTINDNLKQTVDYAAVYEIVSKEMAQKRRLLETLASLIVQKILQQFDTVQGVNIKIIKFNPPVGGVCSQAFVELRQER